MKNKVKIEGLDCPNCARSLEKEICKIKSVKNAKIDFLKSLLEYESDQPEESLKDIKKLTKKLEPSAKISTISTKNSFVESETDFETENNSRNNHLAKNTDIKKVYNLKENNHTENTENKTESKAGFKSNTSFLNVGCSTCEINSNNTEKEKIHSNKEKIHSKQTKELKKLREINKNLIFDVVFLVLGIAVAIPIFLVNLPTWAYWTLYVLSALILGYKTYYKAIRLLLRGIINENLLITISVVGASVISEQMEGLMVIALYSIGKIFEGLAVDKSRKSIEKLAKMQPDYAVILDKDGTEHRVSPQDVKVGTIIVVKAGEKIALDGKILSGECSIDMQSLTGESVPMQVKTGDEVMSGSIVLDGVLKIRTTSNFSESTMSKIMDLVENASENKSKTETFISKITRWYTLAIMILAISVWGIVWAITKNFDTALYRGLIFLVISCPCAFAISVPLTYFSGLGNASKHGILIKGSNYLDACSRLKTVAFDKTGTLTTGQFQIEKINSFDRNKDESEILYLCALGEQNSLHPLAKAITQACKKELKKVSNFKEIAGRGVEFKFNMKDYFVGRKSENLSSTEVELFENNVKIGEIILSDTIKDSSKETCATLKQLGIKTILLSGDNEQTVQKVASCVGVQEAYGKMLPQDKYEWIKSHKNQIGYVGDGINDAPSLTIADVGFSMGINGSPASIEASDVVLVDDDPKKIISAIQISKYTRKIVLENIILSAVVKIIFLVLGALGITGMLLAVFADVGVTLIAIFNSLQALKYKPKLKISNNNKKKNNNLNFINKK